jgi:hypothetical protein
MRRARVERPDDSVFEAHQSSPPSCSGACGELPQGWRGALEQLIRATNEKPAAVATRVSSQQVLNALAPLMPGSTVAPPT